MSYKPQQIIQALKHNKNTFGSLFVNRKEIEYNWRPHPNKWNLKEILCHLVDEELFDFRPRLKYCIEENAAFPPVFDPEGWVLEKDYANQNYQQKLQEFIKERDNSIQWLENIEKPNWEGVFKHSRLGDLSGNFFLANWLAHDQLHIRQILRTQYAYWANYSKEDLRYAGEW